MSLGNVLSTLRKVILDHEAKVPEDLAERRMFFSSLDPELDADELDDFCNINPLHLGFYTRTIFGGEANVIGRHLRHSVRCLETWLEGSFDLRKEVAYANKSDPWKGLTTDNLLLCFQNYILERYPEAPPLIRDMLSFEREALKLKRYAGENHVSDLDLSYDELKTLSLNELLDLKFGRAKQSSLLHFTHDILGVIEQRKIKVGRSFICEIPQNEAFYLGSRDREGAVSWTHIEKNLYLLLKEISFKEVLGVEEFAKALQLDNPETEEMELAKRFAALIYVLVLNNSIFLRR